MSTAATAWFAWLRDEKRYPETTLAAYQHDLDQWTQHLEQLSCTYAQVTRHEFRDWLAAMAADGLSRATIARRVSAIRSFYRHGHRNGYFDTVELTYMKPPKQLATIPKALAETDAAELIAAINSLDGDKWVQARDIALLSLLYGCGLRLSEALTCGAVMRRSGHGCGSPARAAKPVMCRLSMLSALLSIPILMPARLTPAQRGHCLSAVGVVRSMPGRYSDWLKNCGSNWGSTNTPHRMPCAIPLPHICWPVAVIYAPFRRCSAMPACPQPSVIRVLMPPNSKLYTRQHTHVQAGMWVDNNTPIIHIKSDGFLRVTHEQSHCMALADTGNHR